MAIVALAAACSIGPGLGQATLWEPDEPRFAEAARQMFVRGDFLTPFARTSGRRVFPRRSAASARSFCSI
jgi:4-amino-4-deoxy-L-arabinose transferase-like glycosyltransferase